MDTFWGRSLEQYVSMIASVVLFALVSLFGIIVICICIVRNCKANRAKKKRGSRAPEDVVEKGEYIRVPSNEPVQIELCSVHIENRKRVEESMQQMARRKKVTNYFHFNNEIMFYNIFDKFII